MTCHIWGDDWAHWDELYTAEKWMVKLYERITHKYMVTKEKYGTIRYEHAFGWLTSEEDIRIFKLVIRKAVKKFPNVAGEIVADIWLPIDDPYFEGWCAGITWVTCGSYWSSNDRPKGV